MKKSFKKSIAVLLAVLMVVCAFPLTAFAAEKPNVNLQFGVLSVSKTDKRTYSTKRTASANALTISGLMSAKLDYNKSAGTITDSADSYTYAVGDYFTATVLLENVSQLAATQVAINYSSNIVPAGICDGDKKLYGAGDEVGTVSDTFKAGEPILVQSGDAIHNTNSTVGELSYIDMDTNTMYASFAAQDGSDYVSTASTSIGVNTFTNTAVLATFAFKITAEGPISFSLANTTDADEAYYLGTLENGGNVSEYITYAPTENAGSTGLDFMGGNEYVATTKYTIVFKNEEGSVISSTEYDEGAAVTVPDLPATTKDETKHYTYAWDVEPSLTAVANATYQVVKTGAAHTWDEGVVTQEPTATEAGEKTFTCTFDGCGATKTEAIPATGETHTHTWGAWVYNGDSSFTSSSDYKNGTQTRTCTGCGETETIEAPNTGLLRRRGNNITLESSIVLTTYVATATIDYYDEAYVVYERNGQQFVVDLDKSKTYNAGSTVFYQFDYPGITPQALGDVITSTVYGVKDGVLYWGTSYDYSITSYVTKQLNTSQNAKFKTLLVDLMYYGASCQIHANYKTDEMLTDILKEEQKALHSSYEQSLTNIKNLSYDTSGCTNRLVQFGTSVRLSNSVDIACALRLTDVTVDDIKIVAQVGSRTIEYTKANDPDNFEYLNGYWYFYCDAVYANQMSLPVYITAYRGDEKISYTMLYSIESYAATYSKGGTMQAVLRDMIYYGKAAEAYGNS